MHISEPVVCSTPPISRFLLSALSAAAMRKADARYGRRLSDEWLWRAYHVWSTPPELQQPRVYQTYLKIYNQLSVSPNDTDIPASLRRLFTQTPFLPSIPRLTESASTTPIPVHLRDHVAHLSALIQRYYYFGLSTQEDIDERKACVDGQRPLNDEEALFTELFIWGMVIVCSKETKTLTDVCTAYGALTKRTVYHYHSNLKNEPPEILYPVTLPDQQTVRISNRILTALCVDQNMLVLHGATVFTPDLRLLLEALFLGAPVKVNGVRLQIDSPPLILASLGHGVCASMCKHHIQTEAYTFRHNVLFC